METSCGISSNVVPCGFTYTTVAFVKFCCFFKPKYFWSKLFFLAKFYLINIFWTEYFFTIFFGKNFLFLFELKKNWISKACILNLESPLIILNHFIVTQKLSLIFLLLRSALIINPILANVFRRVKSPGGALSATPLKSIKERRETLCC